MYGSRPSSSSAQLARAQSLTRDAIKRAGPDVFPDVQNHEAVPRSRRSDEVLEVEGTGIRFVASMPINPNRQTAGLGGADGEGVERMRPYADVTMARKF